MPRRAAALRPDARRRPPPTRVLTISRSTEDGVAERPDGPGSGPPAPPSGGGAAGARARLRARVSESDTGKAAGLAVATLVNNAIQLVFTILVTRLLGKADYSALAALTAAFLILLVGGQALQTAAAREVALGHLGDVHLTVRRWTRTLLFGAIGLAVVGALLRHPIAHLVSTPEHPWGAAAILPTGALWLTISLQRGVLQGLHAFGPVGTSIVYEGLGRLVFGGALALVAGVTGAFLGTPLCFLAVAVILTFAIEKRLGPIEHRHGVRHLRDLVSDGWVPIVGLALLAVLQNVDVIIARHQLGEDKAGSYAVAAVAAKSVVWVAIGIGLQVLPQATQRAAAGQDPRPVLLRALGVLAVIAAPALLIFAVVPKLLLRVAFGPETQDASGALLVLGGAMTLLAVAYLTVQYLFALGHTRFLWVLAVVAIGEILLLLSTSVGLTGYAGVVLGTQAVAAVAVLLLAVRARATPRIARRVVPVIPPEAA